MIYNVQWVMYQPMDLNAMYKLWKIYFSNVLLHVRLFEFLKVAKLFVIQIMGFVEDERIFSTLMFIKTRLHIQLCEHLDLVVYMFAQPFHIVYIFPYDNTITPYINEKVNMGLLA